MQGGKTDKVIYKELSYKIVGILFDVYNELGYGHPKKYYHKAIEKAFEISKIKYKREVYYKLTYKDKIILEIKKGGYYSKKNIEQIKGCLNATGMKLAILANFTPKGVKFYRILNL